MQGYSPLHYAVIKNSPLDLSIILPYCTLNDINHLDKNLAWAGDLINTETNNPCSKIIK